MKILTKYSFEGLKDKFLKIFKIDENNLFQNQKFSSL